MGTVNITINDKQIIAPEGSSVLNAAGQNGISIPALCDNELLDAIPAELNDEGLDTAKVPAYLNE